MEKSVDRTSGSSFPISANPVPQLQGPLLASGQTLAATLELARPQPTTVGTVVTPVPAPRPVPPPSPASHPCSEWFEDQ